MASKFDLSSLTLNPTEAQSIAEAIIEAELVNGELASMHNIETGITHKQQIVFVGHLANSLKKAAGCTPGEGGQVALTQKYWDPEIFTTRLSHCADDVSKLFKMFQRARRVNPDFYDRIDSDGMGLLTAVIGMMLRDNIPNIAWFSDKAADVHTGTGVFTTGTDLDLWNVIDGLWKQIFAAIPTTAANFVNIAANEAATTALQQSGMTGAVANALFISMRNKADERLLESGDARFYVSRSIADALRDFLRDKTVNAGFTEITENGKKMLSFDGFPIEVMYGWDRFIKTNFNNTTTLDLPHRALFTTPGNIPIGTTASEDFDTLDSFYDRTLKKNIVDIAFSLDAKFLESYMAVAAY